MSAPCPPGLCKGAACLIVFIFGYSFVQASPNDITPRRDINAVLRAHDQELVKLPNVVGVAVALLPDGKTPCLKLLLAHPPRPEDRALPQSIEGFAVVFEVTGEFRPSH